MLNIMCLSVAMSEGPVPMTAQFTYVLDSTNPNSVYPNQFEQLFPLVASGPYVVQNDDRLLVYDFDSAGNQFLIADVYCQIPQIDMSDGLHVTFTGLGVAIRLWDSPIRGSLWRNADTPHIAGEEIMIGEKCQFNPTIKGERRGNMTPKGYDVNQGENNAYPAFLEPLLEVAPPTTVPPPTAVYPANWTLGAFVRYLCQTQNADETYVDNPVAATGVTLDDYLKSYTPVDPSGYMDLTDPSTYKVEDIILRDFTASNKPWPVALHEQLEEYGFHMLFNLTEQPADDGYPTPVNQIVIFRVDGLDGNAPKFLNFPTQGTSIADNFPDFQTISLVRDQHDMANQYRVESAPNQYEVSIPLWPGFMINAGDAASAASLQAFDTSALAGATNAQRKAYRFFCADEVGLGHYNLEEGDWEPGVPFNFDLILGPVDDGVPQYVHRFRPGSGTLISKDDLGRHRHAELAVSIDYEGPMGAPWDGSGTWQSMGNSGWRLDENQLAIWITCKNPNIWEVPKDSISGIIPGDVVQVVSRLSAPTTDAPPITLLLTTVIEADFGLDALAVKREASPSQFTIERVIDSRENWVKQTIKSWSRFNPPGQSATVPPSNTDLTTWPSVRDDTDYAQSQAEAQRLATEFPDVAGPISAPWITHAVGIGDFISEISGRNISLISNLGASQETPRYPYVAGFSWTLTPNQSTTWNLTDHRKHDVAYNAMDHVEPTPKPAYSDSQRAAAMGTNSAPQQPPKPPHNFNDGMAPTQVLLDRLNGKGPRHHFADGMAPTKDILERLDKAKT